MKKILVIVGPSGSGKSTIAAELKPYGIPELVSHTTRPMRVGDVDGENYHFVSLEEFNKTEMIETSVYAGNHYGLSKHELTDKLDSHDEVVVVADVHGLRQLRELYPQFAIGIFLLVDLEMMVDRMRLRGDTDENINIRLKNAIDNDELHNWKHCDFAIPNINLQDAVEKVLFIARGRER